MSISSEGIKLHTGRKGYCCAFLFKALEFVLSVLLIVTLSAHIIFPEQARGAVGVSNALSYQGRLTDSSGNPLGGTGTNYCFSFSIFDASSGGSKLWPSSATTTSTLMVANGVFNTSIGSVDNFDFSSNDTIYLNIDVAAQSGGTCTGVSWEALSPRQQLNAVAYARVAAEVYGPTLQTSSSTNSVIIGPVGGVAGNPTLLTLGVKTSSGSSFTYVGQSCAGYNGTIWYNSATTRALVCENNIVRAISNATTTLDALGIGGNTAGSPSLISNGTVSLAGGNNVTLSQNGNTITVSAFNAPAISASNNLYSTGTVVISGGANVTVGTNGQTITISAAGGGGGAAISAGTQSVSTGTVIFSNANNISFGMAGSQTITASYVPRPAIAASNTTYTTGTVVFTGGNNVTVTYNGQTVSISAFNQSVQTQNLHNVTLSGNTQGVMAQISSGTMTLAGGNNITLSQNGNAVTIIGGAGGGGIGGIAVAGSTATNGTILFSNGGNVSFGMNGSTITASAPSGGGGGATFNNFQWPPGQYSSLASSISNAVMTIVPFRLPQNLTATRAMAFLSLSGNTNSSGTYSISIALFTRNGSTLSMASSGSQTHAWASSQTSLVFGNRRMSVPININATPGEYWYGIWIHTSNNGLISIHHGAGANVAFSGNVGMATNSSRQLIVGQGIFSNASFTTAMPGSIAITNVKGGINSATVNRQPWILFTNFDLN